jgi:diguanylate cyclase (GGDEF)-like protein
MRKNMFISNSELFRKNRFEVCSANRKTMQNNSLLLFCIAASVTLLSFFLSDTKWETYRIHSCVISALSLAAYLFCRCIAVHHVRLSCIASSAYFTLLLAYSGFFSFRQPPVPQICFFSFLLLYTLQYLMRPLHLVIFSSAASASFIAYAVYSGDTGIVATAANSATVLCTSILMGYLIQRTKLKAADTGRHIALERDTDPLTGLPNRIKLWDEIGKSDAGNPVYGVFMADIDFFKKFNDTYGHYAGDICLKKTGAAFSSCAAGSCIDFFRYGGEEFIALVRRTTVSGNENKNAESFDYDKTASDILDAVRKQNIPCSSGLSDIVTISLGYASDNTGTLLPEELIARADKALYQSKKNGRNRATRWDDASSAAVENSSNNEFVKCRENDRHEGNLRLAAEKMAGSRKLLSLNKAEAAAINIRSFLIACIIAFTIGSGMAVISFINNWWPYKPPYIYLAAFNAAGIIIYAFYLAGHSEKAPLIIRIYVVLLFIFIVWERFFTTKEATDLPFLIFSILIPITFIENIRIIDIFLFFSSAVFSILSVYFLGFSDHTLFTEAVLLILSIVAGNSACLARLSQLENNRVLATQRDTDIVTGLPNRRRLFKELDKAGREAPESEERIAAVYIADIDFFKNFNDTFGHQKGDVCLHKIGDALTSAGLLTGIDFFRYGGEEFVGIVRSRTINGFTASLEHYPYRDNAQRILSEVRGLQIPFCSGVCDIVTLSCGYVITPENSSPSPEKLIEMADEALYRAKEGGRNQAVEFA